MLSKMKRNNKGFTLIELMIVVAIIGILAAIAIPQFSSYRQRAQDSAAKSTLKNLATAQEDYYVQNETYAHALTGAGSVEDSGYESDPNVLVTMQAADADSWSAIASHNNSTNTFTYSSGEGGLQ
jgi:prepilin-type N-terminal cleavage/methylation domain-containing protein